MTGIPTVPDTDGNQVVDSLALGRTTGTTAQSWAGPAMAAESSSLENSSAQQAPGDPTPQDQTPTLLDGEVVMVGNAGYLGAGQPGGNSADVLVPGGLYDDENQIQTVAPGAGTAGGTGWYPGTVPNPMVAPGWTVQSGTGDDYEQMVITTASPLPDATHGTAYSQQLAATGGDGTNTWSVESGLLPSPCTMSTAGLVSGTPTAAGASTFTALVTDSDGNEAQKIFSITVN